MTATPIAFRQVAYALAAALPFTFATAAHAEGPDLSGVTLTIGVQNSGSSVVKALVDASGAFEGTPYTLNWAEFDGANGAVEALHAGAIDIDFGLNFSSPVLNQANADHPWTKDDRPYVVIGANLQLNRGGTAIVVHPNSDIKTVNDLAGKSVSFAKGTANHYFLALAAKKAGLDLKSVTPVLMPLSEARAAFVGGSVDALVTALSNARPLITNGDGKVLTTSDGLYDSYAWFVARPEVLKDPAKEAAVADVLVRLQKSSIWQAQNVDKVAEIFVKEGHQKPADAAVNAAENPSLYVPIDKKVIAAAQNQVDVFYEAGVAKTKVDASLGFDDRFNPVIAANPGPEKLQQAAAGNSQ
jgi:sulfonate transport system substrate-binding protein